MALELTEVCKGINAKYWKIIKAEPNFMATEPTTKVTLGLYVDKAARDAGIRNTLKKEGIQVAGVDLTRDEIYTLLKQSKMIQSDSGESVESNKFATATDC